MLVLGSPVLLGRTMGLALHIPMRSTGAGGSKDAVHNQAPYQDTHVDRPMP